MNLIYYVALVLLGASPVVIYLFLTGRRGLEPTLINYLHLLHKYGDIAHPKLIQMRERGDEEFKRRVATLNVLWEVRHELQ